MLHRGPDYKGRILKCIGEHHFCGARDGALFGVCEDGHIQGAVALSDESDVAHCPALIGTDTACRKVSYAAPGPGSAFIPKGATIVY